MLSLLTPHWQSPNDPPDLDSSAVQIWRLQLADFDAPLLEIFRPFTTRSEHERASQFRFDEDQYRHLAGRSLLRVVLARQFNCAAREVPLLEGASGKPRLDDEFEGASRASFNIAHTKDVVVVALSQCRPIGIDIESRVRAPNPMELARRVLTDAERRQMHAVPPADRPPFFALLWTCKEAFLKGTGTGLRRAPKTVECTIDEETVWTLTDTAAYCPPSAKLSASNWALHSFRVSNRILGTVARYSSLPSSLFFGDGKQLLAPSFPS